MGLFSRKKKTVEEPIQDRDVLASSLNREAPKQAEEAPQAPAQAETTGSGLASVIDLMRSKADGQVTLNLTQAGNNMSYKLYQRGSEIESGEVVPGGEWFKPVAALYTEEEQGPRGVWNRALIVVNPAIGDEEAVQVSFMNTTTSTSHNLNYSLDGLPGVVAAGATLGAVGTSAAVAVSTEAADEDLTTENVVDPAEARNLLDSVSARFADETKQTRTADEESETEDVTSGSAAAETEETELAEVAEDAEAEVTETVSIESQSEESASEELVVELSESAEATEETDEAWIADLQEAGGLPLYTEPGTQDEDFVPFGAEEVAVEETEDSGDKAEAEFFAAEPAEAETVTDESVEAETVEAENLEEEEVPAEAVADDAADETAAETFESYTDQSIIPSDNEEPTTDTEGTDTTSAFAENAEAVEPVTFAEEAETPAFEHDEKVTSESASLTPAISHDGFSASPAQLPDHLDDDEFIEVDDDSEAQPAPASTAYAAPAVVPGNLDAPMSGSTVDVAPSFASQSVTKPSETKKAEGNLVLSEAEVVSRFASAYDALFGLNGTALDVSTVLIRVRTLGSYYDALTHVRRNGFWEQVRTFDLIPEDALSILQLKADSYKEGYGSPLAMNIRFTPGIPVSVAFDYADEEAFVRYPEHLPAQQYVEELRMFPRTGANIPAHMNEALASWSF